MSSDSDRLRSINSYLRPMPEDDHFGALTGAFIAIVLSSPCWAVLIAWLLSR